MTGQFETKWLSKDELNKFLKENKFLKVHRTFYKLENNKPEKKRGDKKREMGYPTEYKEKMKLFYSKLEELYE